MSEIGQYKAQVRLSKVEAYASNIEQNPSFEILRRAMQTVVQERGGRLGSSVVDAQGRGTKCDLAVEASDFPRGVGVRVDRHTGEVAFLYDIIGAQGEVARAICNEVTQHYVAICLIRAMKSVGYVVTEEPPVEKGGKAVVLKGVMLKKVSSAAIDPGGNVTLEFTGFPGQECSHERERLRSAVLGYGIELKAGKIETKRAERIASEMSHTERERRKLGW